MRLLLIEENIELSVQLNDLLTRYNYQCDVSESVGDARYMLDIRNYDLVLLSLEGEQSSETVHEIKKILQKSALIVLSRKEDKQSEINALRAGADDYIRKPLDTDILLVRIEAKLRFGASNIIEIDDLIINPEEEKIIYRGEEIELKGKPFEVLTHLAMHKDQIVSKEQLLDAIWEEPELVTPNVIEVAINQIRQKMDKPLNITTIETVRRRGYRFCFPKKIS